MNDVESTAQMLLRLIHTRGGKILVVGGKITHDLPVSYQANPHLLIWDDTQTSIERKEIPTNTRAILYNRLVSHATAKRLSTACEKLGALKFPMLKPSQLRGLLDGFVVEAQTPRITIRQAPLPPVERFTSVEQPASAPRKTLNFPKGSLLAFISEHFNRSLNYSARGTIKPEAQRLLALAAQAGIQSTYGSVSVLLGKLANGRPTSTYHRKPGVKPRVATIKVVAPPVAAPAPAPVVHTSTEPSGFDEFSKLIADAIASLQLVQEALPQVQEETIKLRGLKRRLQTMAAEV